MAKSTTKVPANRQIVDENGQISEEWHNFFSSIGFTPGAHIPQVASSPTTAQLATTLNSVLSLLASQNRIKSN